MNLNEEKVLFGNSVIEYTQYPPTTHNNIGRPHEEEEVFGDTLPKSPHKFHFDS